MRGSTGYHHPAAYTYDADVHCTNCALEHFGRNLDRKIEEGIVTDSEGNPVHPVFSYDLDNWGVDENEGQSAPYCGDCHEVIA